MNATQIYETVSNLIRQRLPVFVWGPPGIGKSSIVKQIAESEGLAFLDIRLSLLDPTDLKGIPFFDTEHRKGVWAPPSFLPDDEETRGILFLDEINTAPPAVQAAAYQLILDRRVGEYTLPEGWSIVAAGNRENDRGVVYKMPPPLANRFVHLEMEVDFDDWKSWAYRSGIDTSIIAYLHFDTEKLFTFDPESEEKAFATPRSWEYVDRILKAEPTDSLLLDTIAGAVGRDAALGFIAFRKVMDDLPDIEAVLSGETTDVPEDPKVLTALSIGLVNALKQNDTTEHLDNVLRYTTNMPGEFAVMLVRDLQHNGIDAERSATWLEWVEKFAYLLA